MAARLQQARAALALAEAKLDYTQVRAPAAGRVLRRGAEPAHCWLRERVMRAAGVQP